MRIELRIDNENSVLRGSARIEDYGELPEYRILLDEKWNGIKEIRALPLFGEEIVSIQELFYANYKNKFYEGQEIDDELMLEEIEVELMLEEIGQILLGRFRATEQELRVLKFAGDYCLVQSNFDLGYQDYYSCYEGDNIEYDFQSEYFVTHGVPSFDEKLMEYDAYQKTFEKGHDSTSEAENELIEFVEDIAITHHHVPNLIPDITQLKTLFVLESPFKNEMQSAVPCSGEITGRRMSAAIFEKSSDAFGQILKNNSIPNSKQFGIFNTSNFPLEISTHHTSFQKKYARIKTEDKNWKGDLQSHLKSLLNVLIEIDSPRFPSYSSGMTFNLQNTHELVDSILEYKTRLSNIIRNADSMLNIVVCGFIAQATFIHLLKIKRSIPFGKPEKRTLFGKEVNIIFVNHPANRSGIWSFKKDMIS